MSKKIKKIVLGVLTSLAGFIMLVFFQAGLIKVWAQVNGLEFSLVGPFGFNTVFPQEYFNDRKFTIGLSDSFIAGAGTVNGGVINYLIKQKPECICNEPSKTYNLTDCPLGKYASANYADEQCPGDGLGYITMPDLCQFLSKSGENIPANDISEPSYFVDPDNDPGHPDGNESCQAVTVSASGVLSVTDGDISDTWTVELKVPPIAGSIGQDWPAGCPSVPSNDQDYGCDLWIEYSEPIVP